MKARCSKCKALYQISDSRIPDKGLQYTCPRCGNIVFFKRGSLDTFEEKTYCPDCGNEVSEFNSFCSQCGHQIRKRISVSSGMRTNDTNNMVATIIPYKNPKALTSYYLGVFSLIPFIGILLGLTAVILGFLGLKDKRKNPMIKGTVHAIVGIVLGILFGGLNLGLMVALLIKL